MKTAIKIELIKEAIKAECEYHDIPVDIVMGRGRDKETKTLRRRIQYALMDLLILLPERIGVEPLITYKRLGMIAGNVDHSTMIDIRKKLVSYISIYEEDRILFEETRKRMSVVLGVNVDNEKPAELDKVKLYWYHFRRAEKDYNIERQAKYRKILDEILTMNYVALQEEAANEARTIEANNS